MAQLKNLIVNGVARIVGKVFASEFVGKLTGNSDTATRVVNNIAIKLNGGTQEGTNLFTFNGSTAKTVNITPASIGAATNAQGVPVGTVIFFAKATAPTGFIVCNGAAISRTTYSALYSVIGTTFGAGDGSSTFNLPNLIDKFAMGKSAISSNIGAGLPNITGELTVAIGGYAIYSKTLAFKTSAIGGTSRTVGNNGAGDLYIRFNANEGSVAPEIYRDDCTTVQPPAVGLLPCIRYN